MRNHLLSQRETINKNSVVHKDNRGKAQSIRNSSRDPQEINTLLLNSLTALKQSFWGWFVNVGIILPTTDIDKIHAKQIRSHLSIHHKEPALTQTSLCFKQKTHACAWVFSAFQQK
jgi:hypothetical protein